MSFPSGRTVYTFAGISFSRVGDEIVPWFFPEAQYTKDAVLGGGRVYVDMGASVAPPLAFRASCLSAADRFTLKSALGTTGTLTSTTGPFSASATLVKAIPTNVGDYGRWFIDLTFETQPA
jgi:hypothetical protein